MGTFKKLKDAAADGRAGLAAAASAAVGSASGAIEAAEAVAERSGLTKKNGEISKVRVARAALRPTKTAKTVLQASADELEARRSQKTD